MTLDDIIRVLFVEDSPTQALQTMAEMEKAGNIEAEHTETLDAALERLRSGSFDVVLLDLTLPDSQGTDTVLATCGVAPSLPVVVLTNRDDDAHALEALSNGAQDYLIKGQIDPDLLTRCFRYAIKRKGAETELIDAQDELRVRIAELEETRERLEAQSAEVMSMAEDVTKARDMAVLANRALAKKIRETDCLYEVSRALDDPDEDLEDILFGTVNVIPKAWTEPEVIGVRLLCNEFILTGEIATENFAETPWRLESAVIVDGDEVARIQACCLEERPEKDHGPFLASEKALIDEVARRLGQAFARVRIQDELRRLATTDPLTGANNRRHFLNLSQREFNRARRYGGPVTVMMMDIDHFKSVNDIHGHAVGDDVLRTFVRVSKKALREQDILGRLGGEEFAVTLPSTGLEGAETVAERLRAMVEALEIPVPDGVLTFTVSIGIAECGAGEGELEAQLGRADAALYRAKESGRNRLARAS